MTRALTPLYRLVNVSAQGPKVATGPRERASSWTSDRPVWFTCPVQHSPDLLRLLLVGLIPIATACSGVAQVVAPARPTPLPTVTPNPRDVAPSGAQLTPYAVQRLVLETLPFPANTLAIQSLSTVYNGDGTWTVQAEISERVRDLTAGDAAKAQIVSTSFRWTVVEADRSVTLVNDEGQRWMQKNWHPGP